MTPDMKKAEKILRSFVNQGYLSSTYLEDVRYAQKKYKNEYHRVLTYIKTTEAMCLINLYRMYQKAFIFYKNNQEYFAALTKAVKNAKAANCSECADIMYKQLKKSGLDARVVVDSKIDHAFVLVNSKRKVKNYRSGKPHGEAFVVDPWLKRIFTSLDEAYLEFKRMFGAKKNRRIRNHTEYYLYNQMECVSEENIAGNRKMTHMLHNQIARVKRVTKSIIQNLDKEKLQTNPPGYGKYTLKDIEDCYAKFLPMLD